MEQSDGGSLITPEQEADIFKSLGSLTQAKEYAEQRLNDEQEQRRLLEERVEKMERRNGNGKWRGVAAPLGAGSLGAGGLIWLLLERMAG